MLRQLCRTSRAGEVLLSRAQCKIILRQNHADLPLLVREMNLSQKEVEMVGTFDSYPEDSRCLLLAGKNTGLVKVEPSPFERWICAVDPVFAIPRRAELIANIRVEHPNLDYTGALRKAASLLS